MSIEAMKRIKSLLQDGDKIDSHTISAVVAECDAVILTQQPDNTSCKSVQKRLAAQQPATGEPVAWLDEMLADTREVFDAGGSETPQVVRDVIEYVASWVTVYSEKNHPAPSVPDDVVRDAERYRFIRDADVSDDLIPDIALYAMESLDEYIDAAMIASKTGGAA